MDAGAIFGTSPHGICWLELIAPVLLSITRRWQLEPCRVIWIVPVGNGSLAILS